MKTLIFSGSPRPNGDTASLVKILTDALAGEYKLVDCYRADISPCTDCRVCRDKPLCAIDDEMNEVYEYIAECDNVVIASPIYFSQPTGKLLDVCSRFQTYFSARFFRGEEPDIRPKRGGVILTGGGDGDPKKAYETAVCLLRAVNAKEIFPLVCSHDTDRLPAAEDIAAKKAAAALAAFLNRSSL